MVMASPRLFSRLATATARRPATRRIVQLQQLRGIVGTAEDIKTWQEQLVLDDRELHEMQVNACDVYSTNKLFGTYAEASKTFEWMTFQDFAHNVDQCRSVLKDLGESSVLIPKTARVRTLLEHYSSSYPVLLTLYTLLWLLLQAWWPVIKSV